MLDNAARPDNADVYVKVLRKLLRASNMATDITKEYYIMYMYNTSSGFGSRQYSISLNVDLRLQPNTVIWLSVLLLDPLLQTI